jgi:hypothetical protein
VFAGVEVREVEEMADAGERVNRVGRIRSRLAGAYPRRSAMTRPISKWNSPCGLAATSEYMLFTLVSRAERSTAATVVVVSFR